MFEIASHLMLVASYASVPAATAGLLVGITRHAKTAAELERELDTNLQDTLLALTSGPGWARATDKEAWWAIKALGGRRHLLKQARLILALAIEKAKNGDDQAPKMAEQFQQLARLLRIGWKYVFMPQTDARLCVEIFTDLCAMWETQDLEENG